MRHNKKRNTALLYEFLIRHVSRCLVESKNDEAAKTVALIKKYFRQGPLKEELDLYNVVLKSTVKTPEYASRIVTEAVKESRKKNFYKIDKVKSKLISEINRNFNADKIFSCKVPHYVVYASLQNLFNAESGRKVFSESVERIKQQERITTYLLTEKDKKKTVTEVLKLDPQYNSAVYNLVINKFNTRYKESLSEGQKRLLSKYAVSMVSQNNKIFAGALQKELTNIQESLTNIADPKLCKDKDLMNKISECRKLAEQTDPSDVSSQNVVKVLRYMALVQEVQSDE